MRDKQKEDKMEKVQTGKQINKKGKRLNIVFLFGRPGVRLVWLSYGDISLLSNEMLRQGPTIDHISFLPYYLEAIIHMFITKKVKISP
jgi:hypothetical protein